MNDQPSSIASAHAPTSVSMAQHRPAPNTALTPEMILILLERRLDDTDQQIDAAIRTIDSTTARAQAIQQRVEGLQLLKTAMANKESDSGKAVRLEDVSVTWNEETITGVDLLNKLEISDLPTEAGAPVNLSELSESERVQIQQELAELDAKIEDSEIGWYRRSKKRHDTSTNKRVQRRMRKRMKRAKRRIERRSGVDMDAILKKRDALAAKLDGANGKSTWQNDAELSGAALDSYIQQLQSQSRRENSGNEMMMIQLRSAMSQREQSVTMVKSMMDTLNRSLNKLAQW